MFSTLPAYTHALTTYIPHVSSPLSSSPLRNSPSPLLPRDANLPARERDLEMSSPTPTSKTSRSTSQSKSKPSSEFHSSETPMKSSLPSPPPSRGRGAAGRESVYSKRVTKSNPLMNRNADEGREARRKLFLKRVREGSEEKRWRDRNSGFGEGEDEALRSIWVAEERRRVESRRREAVGIVAEVGDEENDVNVDISFDEVMADEVAMKEEQELEALLGSLSQPQEEMDSLLWDNRVPTTALQQNQAETPYGSDDEEYDHIFMDVIEEENRIASQQQQQLPGYLDTEMMDMS